MNNIGIARSANGDTRYVNVIQPNFFMNQATSQANACGDGELPLNVGCQNVNPQILGDENGVALAADQIFPSFENDENGDK